METYCNGHVITWESFAGNDTNNPAAPNYLHHRLSVSDGRLPILARSYAEAWQIHAALVAELMNRKAA